MKLALEKVGLRSIGDILISSESEQKRSVRGVRGINRIPKGLMANRLKAPPVVAPIQDLEDDVRAILKDKRKKVSTVVLRYMLDKRIIKGHLYTVYSGTSTFPEERIMTEINVIADVNSKFLEMYDKT